ncbi:O-antigen ligase family protein [Sphingomonas humi]|uniref:O-antigen ligase-related domain-containing protein n=1 Tax=Sphingomonas humi TaxID=335630 RepID=A0ABP7RPY8_9SPHN
MKWIAFALIILAAPLLAVWLKGNPRQAPWAWGMLTFLPWVLGPWNLDVAPFATPIWSGYVKGWQVSLLDAVAFGIVFGMRTRWPKLVLIGPLLAYLFAASISVLQARFPEYAISYVVQLLRVVLVFLAVARVAEMERGERALLTGLCAGLAVQAGYAIFDRLNGALQTGGSLGHQNLLGFVSHMALMPAFAAFLAGRGSGRALVGVIAGLIVVALTASRATIGIAGVGLILTLVLSLAVNGNGRKVAVGVVGMILLAASFPLAKSALERRFQAQNTSFMSEDLQREAFVRTAKAIIGDYPLGIGPNHYVFISITEGFADRAGVNWSASNRAANVHNAYLLIGAESGYPGLITIVILLVTSIVVALTTAFRFRKQPGAEVLIGVGVGLIAISLHSFVEWMLVVNPSQYLLAASMGIIVGMRSRFLAQQKNAVRSRRMMKQGRTDIQGQGQVQGHGQPGLA